MSIVKKLFRSGDSQHISVAFFCSYNVELRNVRMYPDFLACKTTFGVTKEQRCLFIFTGTDRNSKGFTSFTISYRQRKHVYIIGLYGYLEKLKIHMYHV